MLVCILTCPTSSNDSSTILEANARVGAMVGDSRAEVCAKRNGGGSGRWWWLRVKRDKRQLARSIGFIYVSAARNASEAGGGDGSGNVHSG